MSRLRAINLESDIPRAYASGPIGDLLRWHNLGRPPSEVKKPRLILVTCMDPREKLRMPRNFSFVVRAAGANARGQEFPISFAVAIGGVRTMAIMGHTDCGMSGLPAKKERFVAGMVESGWSQSAARRHFSRHASGFEVGDAATFVRAEAARFRRLYPSLQVAPLMYGTENGRIYLPEK